MLASVQPPPHNQRVANWLARRAIAGEYTRSATPYPTSGRLAEDAPVRSNTDGSAAFFSDDYQPEMADCRGWWPCAG